ncbi:MAG TPA: hypothetical protein VLN41_00315 [Candidatus Bathyarchaeia archaeon]|nr:hypothetical protein [Candidatus Bathyarchaeia archaeon]
MSLRAKCALLPVLALAGLLAVPAWLTAAPDAASGQKAAAAGLSFRLDDDAHGAPATQAEPAPAKSLSKLSVRLYGAYSHIGASDVNKGARGLYDLFALYDALGVGSAIGEYEQTHGGADFGADVIYQISPRFGVGLGAGYMRNGNDPLMAVAVSSMAAILTGGPTLSAVPVRLGVFGSFPVSGKLDLTANAGGAWYAGLKLAARERVDLGSGEWSEVNITGSRSGFANLGFQGALGLEYKVSRTMGLFVEAEGRYARFKNFDSVTRTATASTGESETYAGHLYIETSTFPEGSYSVFFVSQTPPLSTPTTIYEDMKIDLSGFALRAGVHIRF